MFCAEFPKSKSLIRRQTERTQWPWGKWNLDKTFFQSLSRYIMDYPEGRLDIVLDRVSTAIEENQDYLVLIPSNPFPAQGIVKALGCLLRLGMTVKRAKQDTFDFATQVVEWVQAVLSAFEDTEHKRFTFLTWRSLRKTRDLVNEICLWANTRLEDRRWTRLQNGFRIGVEIDEFKIRLADSKESFRDVSLLHLQGGISALLARLRTILFHQDLILKKIRNIKKQQESHLIYIIKEIEEMKRSQVREAFLEKTIGYHTVAKPNYDAQGRYPCDDGTREAELAVIIQWLNSISPGSQNFLWLTGDPGCGKSAVTASVARYCKDEGILWGQFFINRNNAETTDPNSFFLTIARQLASYSSAVEQLIHDQLKAIPSLADCITSEQAAKLFVDTLAAAATLDPGKVVAVIIDGLDEIDRNHLYGTAYISPKLFKSLNQHPNVKVFVSSRTEDHILEHFSQRGEEVNVKHLHLDTSASVRDVALFMRRQIEEIVKRYKIKWEEWPTEEGMELLTTRSSGLFIWAVTAVRYIEERIEEEGPECLDEALNDLTGNALKEINHLYLLILYKAQREDKHSTEWEFFRRIIGAIIVLREPLCLDDLSALLNLRYEPTNIDANILEFVKRLRTVLVAGTDDIDGKTIPRLHKSFYEFITNANFFEQPIHSADNRFYVDPSVAEAEVAVCCLKQHANACKGKGRAPGGGSHSEYARRFYSSHVNAVARKASLSAVALVTLSPQDILSQFSTARRNGPLLPWFSSNFDGSSRMHFYPLTAAYKAADDRRVLATAKSVWSLAYSPNGEIVVSGTEDGRLILWNAKTGIEIATFEAHTLSVYSVAFSSSGDQIASGSMDKTVRIWDVATTQLVTTLSGHSGWVYSVAFSPVENVVASASHDHSIRLWHAGSGELIRSPFQHDGLVYSITFSTTGNEIISGANDGLVYVWNRYTGECQQKLESIISSVHSVTVSPLGDRLAATGWGGLCFWNRVNSKFALNDQLTLKLGGGSFFFQSVFSPDGDYVLVSDRSARSLFVYDLNSLSKIPIHGENEIEGFALSPDGSSVVFCFSYDKNIYISDIPRLPPITLTVLSPDADIVACASLEGSVWIESPKNLPMVSKQLEGNVGNVKQLTFSSNNSLLAAVNDDSIYLWDVSTWKLRGRASSTELTRITEISFLSDQCTLVSMHENQCIYVWNEVDGTLHSSPSSSGITFDPQLLLLEVDEDNVYETADARWFPAKSQNLGLWAYIDDTLIRTRRDGTITLLPLSST